jgi:hypothetical protein
MAVRTKIKVAALVSATVAAMMVALTLSSSENVTAAAAKHDHAVTAELRSVGGSGLHGLAVAREHAGKLRFHATLACSQACPTGTTASGVRVHFKFAQGRCGKPSGRTFAVAGARLGPGGLDVKGTMSFDSGNDPSTYSVSLRATWDPDNDGKFEPAACDGWSTGWDVLIL